MWPGRSTIARTFLVAWQVPNTYSVMSLGSLRIVSIEASYLSGFQFVCSYYTHLPGPPALQPLRPLRAPITLRELKRIEVVLLVRQVQYNGQRRGW